MKNKLLLTLFLLSGTLSASDLLQEIEFDFADCNKKIHDLNNIVNHSETLKSLTIITTIAQSTELSIPLERLMLKCQTITKLHLKPDIDQTLDTFSAPMSISWILDVLSENKTIENFTLNLAGIGKEGAIALANLLKNNKSLKELEINPYCNRLSQSEIKSITAALQANSTLSKLTLSIDFRSNDLTCIHELVSAHKSRPQPFEYKLLLNGKNFQ